MAHRSGAPSWQEERLQVRQEATAELEARDSRRATSREGIENNVDRIRVEHDEPQGDFLGERARVFAPTVALDGLVTSQCATA